MIDKEEKINKVCFEYVEKLHTDSMRSLIKVALHETMKLFIRNVKERGSMLEAYYGLNIFERMLDFVSYEYNLTYRETKEQFEKMFKFSKDLEDLLKECTKRKENFEEELVIELEMKNMIIENLELRKENFILETEIILEQYIKYILEFFFFKKLDVEEREEIIVRPFLCFVEFLKEAEREKKELL